MLKLNVGGQRHSLGHTFFELTVLTNVDTSMKIAQEETFGSVAPLIRLRTEARVIKIANQSNYRLASYLFTKDHARMWRIAENLEDGIVSINLTPVCLLMFKVLICNWRQFRAFFKGSHSLQGG